MFSLLMILTVQAEERGMSAPEDDILGVLPAPTKEKSDFSWKAYGIGVGATALSIPISTFGAGLLTKSSNKLVMGMLPPVLCGIVVPSSTAFFSSNWMIAKEGKTLSSPGLTYGLTTGLGVGLFTTQTVMGVSSDQMTDMLIAGTVNALLLPLPTVLMAKDSNITTQLSVKPSQDGMVWSGGIYGTF